MEDFCVFSLKIAERQVYFYSFIFVENEADMNFYTTDSLETRSGAFSAVSLSSVRISAPISIASDALIAIIISQTAR